MNVTKNFYIKQNSLTLSIYQNVSTPEQVTSKAKRAILVDAVNSVSQEAIDNDFYSLYSIEQSERE